VRIPPTGWYLKTLDHILEQNSHEQCKLHIHELEVTLIPTSKNANNCLEHLKCQGLKLEEIAERLGYETPGLLLEALGDLEYGSFSYVNHGYMEPDDTDAKLDDYQAALVCFLKSGRDYTWVWTDEGRV
jgi:hypothetical protein